MPNGALIAHYQMPRDLCKLWPEVSHHGHDGDKGTDFKIRYGRDGLGANDLAMREKGFEKCYNLKLDWGVSRTAYCVSVERLRYYLLLTAIHRLLARAVHDYLHSFTTSSYLHRHDST